VKATIRMSRTKRHQATLSAIVALVLGTAAACSSNSSPANPTAPTTPSATVTAVTISSTATSTRSFQLNATARLSDGTTKDVTAGATWNSSNPSLATVSSTGLVTVVGTGELDVRATYQNIVGTLHLFVATLPVVRVDVAGAPLTASSSFQLTATARLSDGSTQDVTNSAVWSSSNPAVAKVVAGYVSILSNGDADITALYLGVPGSTHATVVMPKSYTLSGAVTEPAPSLRPVVGARVQVMTGSFATTDAQGKYSIASVTEGRQLIEVSKDGYQTFEQEVVICGDMQFNVTLAPVQTMAVRGR
jgi:hypothetical protein